MRVPGQLSIWPIFYSPDRAPPHAPASPSCEFGLPRSQRSITGPCSLALCGSSPSLAFLLLDRSCEGDAGAELKSWEARQSSPRPILPRTSILPQHHIIVSSTFILAAWHSGGVEGDTADWHPLDSHLPADPCPNWDAALRAVLPGQAAAGQGRAGRHHQARGPLGSRQGGRHHRREVLWRAAACI